ncbi:MAG TPA: SDR family oxidoreductase [Solirubrobacteraceae bacterium]|nr:SDR family oxidoreductase [Solirubrobacteraceae bacterium]
MRVFVTGASGHIGSAVVPELIAGEHHVVGMARSEESARKLRSWGAEVVRADLDDLDAIGQAAAESDGVIHLAFRHDWMRSGDFMAAVNGDLAVVRTIGDALAGTSKAFVGTGGTMMLAMAGINDRPGTEADALPGGPRVDAENEIIAMAERGVRSAAIRLAPLVHSDLDKHGFGPTLIAMARERGASAYIGDGQNRWPAADTRDIARLYRLAVESAPAGTRLHGVADEGVPFRQIAEAIGRKLDLPTVSVAPEDAEQQFGFLARFVGLDNPTSSAATRALLGWEPREPGLIADIEQGHYFE